MPSALAPYTRAASGWGHPEGETRTGVASTLAKRGLDAAERTRLRKLVEIAQSQTPIAPPDAGTSEDKHLASLVALRAWFDDWGKMAKVAVKRRDYRIRLGFAQRKAPVRRPPPVPAPAPPPASTATTTSKPA